VKRIRRIKAMRDGRAMLNLGCGPRTHADWTNVDFSPYARLARHRRFAAQLRLLGLLSEFRYHNVLKTDPDFIHWDIRRGLPFAGEAFDVVYHAHFIIHIDRAEADFVTRECRRVLKPGGILRSVVPDLREIIRLYDDAVVAIEQGRPDGPAMHEHATGKLFSLMVRREARGTSLQRPWVRRIERFIRGNVAQTGELQRYHYDEFSMGRMMRAAGFRDVWKAGPAESRIEGWNRFGLDLNEGGSVYRPGALYMEALR